MQVTLVAQRNKVNKLTSQYILALLHFTGSN